MMREVYETPVGRLVIFKEPVSVPIEIVKKIYPGERITSMKLVGCLFDLQNSESRLDSKLSWDNIFEGQIINALYEVKGTKRGWSRSDLTQTLNPSITHDSRWSELITLFGDFLEDEKIYRFYFPLKSTLTPLLNQIIEKELGL